MPPAVATAIFAFGTIGLFVLYRNGKTKTSPALWLAIVWLAVGGSRNVSLWFGTPALAESPDQYLEGSPLDRAFLTALVATAGLVLVARRRRVVDLLRRNPMLVVFVLYSVASVAWSDFPFVAFKRWTKMLGNVAMVLIVVTDRDPVAAVKTFLTRTAFLLIPASILLIKYYPEFGRIYDRWEGQVFYTGVTADKNMLGCICMVTGFGSLFELVHLREQSTARIGRFVALTAVLVANLWVLLLSKSATSLACLLVGSSVIVVLRVFRQRPALVHAMVGGMVATGAIAFTYPDAFALFVQSLGRNTTLTGRTDLWTDVLQLDTRPWFGTGFESFFLGDRLELLWGKYWWHPNEAHNGYLETYLTLGIVGLAILGCLMLAAYRDIIRQTRAGEQTAGLRLAFLVTAPLYNITESAFKVMNPMWVLFLFAVIAHRESAQAVEDAVPAPVPPLRPRLLPIAAAARSRVIDARSAQPAAPKCTAVRPLPLRLHRPPLTRMPR